MRLFPRPTEFFPLANAHRKDEGHWFFDTGYRNNMLVLPFLVGTCHFQNFTNLPLSRTRTSWIQKGQYIFCLIIINKPWHVIVLYCSFVHSHVLECCLTTCLKRLCDCLDSNDGLRAMEKRNVECSMKGLSKVPVLGLVQKLGILYTSSGAIIYTFVLYWRSKKLYFAYHPTYFPPIFQSL